MKQSISINNGVGTIGPYSQAIKINDFIFISGQLGLDFFKGKFVSNSIMGQTEQILKNVILILNEVNLTLKNIVKVTVFLSDISNYLILNEIWGRYFTPPYPARTVVAVKALPKNALIEIEAIAHVFSI